MTDHDDGTCRTDGEDRRQRVRDQIKITLLFIVTGFSMFGLCILGLLI